MHIKLGSSPLAALLLAMVLLMPALSHAQSSAATAAKAPAQPPITVGMIDWVQGDGRVYLKPKGSPGRHLRPGIDGGTWITASSMLWVARGGRVGFYIKKTPVVLRGPKMYQFPATISAMKSQLPIRFGAGGGDRAPLNFLMAPFDGSLVRPDHIIVRWNPVQEPVRLKFRLLDWQNAVLWESGEVDGSTGWLVDSRLNQALTLAQNDTEPVRLTLRPIINFKNVSNPSPDVDTTMEVHFRVISRSLQMQVEDEMKPLNNLPGILPILLRADISRRSQLDGEVAYTLELAHLQYPLSETIFQQLIAAEHHIGNYQESTWLLPHTNSNLPAP